MSNPDGFSPIEKISAVLEKFDENSSEPFERIFIEDDVVVKIEKKGVDY